MPAPLPISAAGPVAVALHEGFLAVLDALAEHHGNTPGAWLDAVEEEAIKRAKGAAFDGMPMHLDAALVAAGVEAMKTIFAAYKRALSER
jgi:hypothetical protein